MKTRISLMVIILLAPLLAGLVRPAVALEEINKSFFGDITLGGYDAVSYFLESKAVKGDQAHAAQWKGATWLFSSAANRRLFLENPDRFAPQYGGYCSNQMSLGNLSDTDPEVWRVIDNKLYLFGHEAGRVRWANETTQRIIDADQHWRRYLAR